MVIVLEIEDRCFEKPFLGGWRNLVTGTEYHDARTQTCPGDNVVYPRASGKKQRKDDPATDASCFTRGSNVITETRDRCVGTDTSVLMVVLAPYRCKYTSVAGDRATQTSRLPDLRDKLVTPLLPVANPEAPTPRTKNENVASTGFSEISRADGCREERINENGEMHFSRLEEDSAVKIQKCYRAYRARVDIGTLARLSRETRAQTPPESEEIHHFRHCRSSQFEIINRAGPTKRSDIQMLENVLERWRFYENARLDRGFFGTSKLAALRVSILNREIELLRSIERIKTRLRGERKQRRCLENLDKLAESEVWSVANGRKRVLVDTLRVQRARECRDFYRSLLDESLRGRVRIEILKNLRKYASQHTCKYAEDLVSLIDQEIELLAINYDEKIMNSLRKRLVLAMLRLTMNFCAPKRKFDDNDRTAEAAAFCRARKTKKSSLSKLCKRCGKFLTIDALSASLVPLSFEALLPTCENCRKIQPGKEAKIVFEPYEIMLRDLRISEIDLGASPSTDLAFVVDSTIIYRLVNYVWHGKSGISESDDLYRLVLVRFRTDIEWSPWNNLVLTRREAALHKSMRDPWKFYAATIMKKFIVKNLQAKLRFDFCTRTNFCRSISPCTQRVN